VGTSGSSASFLGNASTRQWIYLVYCWFGRKSISPIPRQVRRGCRDQLSTLARKASSLAVITNDRTSAARNRDLRPIVPRHESLGCVYASRSILSIKSLRASVGKPSDRWDGPAGRPLILIGSRQGGI